MIKILAIGNSFSQDATTYLYDIAKQGGDEIKVVNLYIGGCSLQLHWENVQHNKADYMYQINGVETDRSASIKEVLQEEEWDYITLQQASHDSGKPETYYPYITLLSDYIKQLVPKAKQMIHQTWAYETDSDHGGFVQYHCDQKYMYEKLKQAYQEAAHSLPLPIIPCGDVIQQLRSHPLFDYQNGGRSLCRDGYHMDLTYGRFATAAVWYECLLGKNILDNSYLPPVQDGELLNEECCKVIKQYVHKIVSQ